MKGLIDWFWDGVLLKRVTDLTLVRSVVLLYFIMFIFITVISWFLIAPSMLVSFKHGIWEIDWLFIWFGMIVQLTIISVVLVKTYLHYRTLLRLAVFDSK